MAIQGVRYTFADYSHELAAMGFNAASTAAPGDFSGLTIAIDAITLCVTRQLSLTETAALSSSYPTDVWANRELKVLIGYSDAVTGAKYTTTIPGPDLDALTMVAGSDSIVLADSGPMAAFVTAFELVAKSPDDNAVNVDYAKLVGRNN